MWIVYKTINLTNNKYYIGVHDLNSKKGYFYLGSGKILKLAIKKYSRENFTRDTIASFDTESKAYNFEKKFLTAKLLNDPACYNITEGGNNPPTFYGKDNPFYGKTHTKEVMKKIIDANIGKIPWNKNISHTELTKEKISKAKKGKKLGKSPLRGRKLSEEHKTKLIGITPWNKGIKGGPPPYSTSCVVHGQCFSSIQDAATCFGISRTTVRRKCTLYGFPDCYLVK